MELVLDRVGSSIEKYNWIMKRVQEVDVSADADFQRFFNGFYRIRQRPASFYKAYYAFMEQHKHDPALTFEDVLTHLYRETGTMQASFSSKLLATVNPDMPWACALPIPMRRTVFPKSSGCISTSFSGIEPTKLWRSCISSMSSSPMRSFRM